VRNRFYFLTIGNCAKTTSPFVLSRYKKTWIGEQPSAAIRRFFNYRKLLKEREFDGKINDFLCE